MNVSLGTLTDAPLLRNWCMSLSLLSTSFGMEAFMSDPGLLCRVTSLSVI